MSARPVLFLEPIGGIAGDMFLAAAVDLGIPLSAISEALAGLEVPGWSFSTSRAERHAIAGTHLDVVVAEPEHHPHRPLSEIRALIQAAPTMSDRAKQRALRVFEVIGDAEAKIHDVPVEQVHFHEVGAVDSIVDICGAAVVLDLLGDPEVFASPPPLGSGFIRAAHGSIPVPAPATLEILRDVPVRFEGVGELTTPTGAGLLKALCRIEPPPSLVIDRVGYGVGTKDFKDRPNVVRASLGHRATAAGSLYVIEANVDDTSPQLLAILVERALQLGALDAWVLPAVMKKGRPGHQACALVEGEARERIIEAFLRETTTLGVRYHPVERVALERKWVPVQTPYGGVRMKLGLRGGAVLNAHPELEDCRARAEERGVPVKEVIAAAIAAYGR